MKTYLLLALLLLPQEVARPQFGSVAGQIRAIDGSPAAAVRVAVMAVDETGDVNPGASTLASLSQTDPEGRYRLENIPPGRYLIMAGFLESPSFFPGVKTPTEARSITVGPGSALNDLDFTLARVISVRVRGNVKNVPNSAPQGLLRVTLQPISRLGGQTLDAALAVDHTFEFPQVQPGSYMLRLFPTALPPVRVEVGEWNYNGLELTATPMLLGRVTLEDGKLLPVQAAAVASGIADPPAPVRLQASKLNAFATVSTATVRRDGLFILSFPSAGEYRINATLLPLGYNVKSMAYGAVDLLQSPINVQSESAAHELQVVLTTTPPAGTPPGFKVTGRIKGLETAGNGVPAWMSLSSPPTTAGPNQVSMIRTGEAPVKEDGTFEIAGVPPGNYILRYLPATYQGVSVFVTDRDVTDLELAIVSSTNPLMGGIIIQPALPPSDKDSATLTVSQTGRGPAYREGAVSYALARVTAIFLLHLVTNAPRHSR
jgi:hypothetical protein